MAAKAKYETADFSMRTVLMGSVGLAAIMVFFAALMWWLMLHFAAREERASARPHPLAQVSGPQLPPEPRLQAKPRQDLLSLRAWEEETLTTYDWVDREAGVVRIPIQRAIGLLSQRGFAGAAREGGATK